MITERISQISKMLASGTSAPSHPQLTADDISCDQTECFSSKLDIFDLSSSQCKIDEPAKSSASELPPPHPYRRQLGKKGLPCISRSNAKGVDPKVQSQMQDYIVKYRQATGRLLTEASTTARHMKEDEVHVIARLICSRPQSVHRESS